ncbi:MAG TPA: alanine racemase [Pyrinomonadaceae bacterium]|jgi:alanine racemase
MNRDELRRMTASKGQRPTWAEIDLSALAANLQTVRRVVGSAVRVLAVVKADAYGHGAVECARRLAGAGADWFGVALPEEGVELRAAGITQPILCLEGFWAGQAELCLRHQLTPALFQLDTAQTFDSAARAAGVVADVHVKIDTGMGRLGVRYEAAGEFARALREFKHLRVDGLMTHFAAANEPARDAFTAEQTARFHAACAAFRACGHAPRYEDLANSAGAFAHPSARGNMVRPGGVLYGLWRDVLPPQGTAPALRPVLAWRTHVALLKWIAPGDTLGYGCTFTAARRTRVATLPVGYHDGYPRALSNRGRVVVSESFAPVIGRISMDLTLVDVTDVAGVSEDDPVTLLGAAGALEVPADELARAADTIAYEITCGISRRVPRHYLP